MNLSISHWIAIISVTISILALSYTIFSKWSDKKEKLQIQKKYGFLTYGHQISKEYYLFIECINLGERDVMLSSCFLKLPNKKTIPAFYRNPLGADFPYELSIGKNFQYLFDVEVLQKTLIKEGYKSNVILIPNFTTQKGKIFSGKPFDFSLEN